MKICAYCGHKLSDDELVCPECGNPVEAQEEEAEELAELAEEPEQAAKPERKAAPRRAKPRAFDSDDEKAAFDPFEAPKAAIAGFVGKGVSFISGKAEAPAAWQTAVAALSVLGAIFFIIAACCGAVQAIAGVAASLTMGFLCLRKPRFNAVGMLIPILLFAVVCLSLAGTFHGYLDYMSKEKRSTESMEEKIEELSKKYGEGKINYDEYRIKSNQAQKESEEVSANMTDAGLAAFKRYDTNYTLNVLDLKSLTKLTKLYEGEGNPEDLVSNNVGNVPAIIFRVFVYAMAAIYALALYGVLRSVTLTAYAELGLSAACGVFGVVKLLGAYSTGGRLFWLGAFVFMLCWFVFTLKSDKTSAFKRNRALHRLLHINPAPAKNYEESHPYDNLGGALMVARVLAYVLAGILAALGLYIIVLIFITLGHKDWTGGYSFWYVVVSLFQSALLLGTAYLGFLLGQKIALRDDSFLRHYNIFAVCCVCMAFMLCSAPIIPGWALLVITVGSLALFAAGTFYFVRSKRVYVYMDTNRYITQSSLTKKFQPPQL